MCVRAFNLNMRGGIFITIANLFFGFILFQKSAHAAPDGHLWKYPIAPHMLYMVSPGEELEISTLGYDLRGRQMITTIKTLPASGQLYQLSTVYNNYGYEPKLGAAVNNPGTTITGKNNRFFYKAPTSNNIPYGKYDTFKYTITTVEDNVKGIRSQTSSEGYITVVPKSHGMLVASDFMSNADDWKIVGNKNKNIGYLAAYDGSSRGKMNRYILGADEIIDNGGIDSSISSANNALNNDRSLWFFQAPNKFLGNHGLVYKGFLTFTLSSFAGSFDSKTMNSNAHLVYLECAGCNSNAGVRLGFPLKTSGQYSFAGVDTTFEIPLDEKSGWVEDTKNTAVAWQAPTRCTMIQVLSGLSKVLILGDHTQWYESVGLDSVGFYQIEKNQGGKNLPPCAQGAPDSHLCECA